MGSVQMHRWIPPGAPPFRPEHKTEVPHPSRFLGKGGHDAADSAGLARMLMAHASEVPTLRKMREGWGTHSFCAGSEIKRMGHPPPFAK